LLPYSHRIFMYGPIALLVILAAGYSLYWRASAQELAAELDAANGHEIVPGIEFAFAEKSIGGYPFRLDAVLSGVTFAHKGVEGETAWRAENIALHTLSYGSSHYLLETAGLQSFAWPDDQGRPRVFYVTPGTARASVVLRRNKLARFDLDVVKPILQDAAPDAIPGRNATVSRAQLHLRQRQDKTLDVAVKLEGTRIGPGFSPALGRDLLLLSVRGVLRRSEKLKSLLAGEESPAAACEAWRLAGGSFDVTALSMKWDGVTLDGTGTFALDTAHRLMGALNGFAGSAKSLADAAERTRQTPTAELGPAHAAVSAIGETAADAQGRVPLNIELERGVMTVGLTQIASFEPLY